MSLDAQEMSWTKTDIEHFVLVCGDRDFIPVVKRLQQRGKTVHVIGLRVSTSRDLMNFVGSNYSAVEELLGIIPAKGVVAAKAREDATLSMETVCAKLADFEPRLKFVAVSHFVKNILEGEQSEKSAVFNRAVAAGLIETYQIPNPKSQEHPTTCCRLAKKKD